MTLPCRTTASRSTIDLGAITLPDTPELVLAECHSALGIGERLTITTIDDDRSPNRAECREVDIDLVEGAGFEITARTRVRIRAIRAAMLPDTVGPRTRLLVVGLNPGTHSTAKGFAFAGPGNRFWPAAVAAGLTVHPHDPVAAAREDGLALTNLVRRTTARAAELSASEYRSGVPRLGRLVARVRPGVVCFVGLAGYRAAFSANADAGRQPESIAGSPVYVMPSTSGLNARTPLAALVEHFRAADALVAARP
ncbi:MAG: mismatch-specific DNA-glycosylase [Actinomycetota bacterium]